MPYQQKIDIAGNEIIIETGKVARQAHGLVTVQAGGTVILATAVASKKPDTFKDFFPLFVEYRQKMYAAGKIPGGFFKREGRPTTKETLYARLIDRSIRPLFPDGFKHEVQVFVNVLSFDKEHDPGLLGIIGASAALTISKIPFQGPVGGVGIGRINGEFVVNPGCDQLEESSLDLVVSGTKTDLLMIEGGAKEETEDVMVAAIGFAQEQINKIVTALEEMKEKAGQPVMEYKPIAPDQAIHERVVEMAGEKVKAANIIPEKDKRYEALDRIADEIEEALGEDFEEHKSTVRGALEELEKKEVRRVITEEGKRIDGRDMDTIRPITCEVGVLPRVHGSALFTRGQTQSMGVLTLGTKRDEQLMEELEGTWDKNYMLHYNFPSFSVGETGPVRGPGRREIGHGALAERSLEPVLPTDENFPYTIRIVSEILESNGSSSMASICSGCLSLMDGGVPVKAPVAGIAMGLIMHGGKPIILTDILGAEDHCGDMDFKVAGTREGITGFQMDVKTTDITLEILTEALAKARAARLSILEKMTACLDKPRAEISEFAPQIITVHINPEKIGALIGPGGKVIKGIQEQTGATINVENDGTVLIAAVEKESGDQALAMVEAITEEAKVGTEYTGKVVRLMNFGAFVEILPGTDGMVHISELADYRVAKVDDVVKIGDEVKVKVIEVDDQGRINLSMKQVDGYVSPKPPQGGGGQDRPRRNDRPRRDDRPRREDRRPKPAEGEAKDDPKKSIEQLEKQLSQKKKD